MLPIDKPRCAVREQPGQQQKLDHEHQTVAARTAGEDPAQPDQHAILQDEQFLMKGERVRQQPRGDASGHRNRQQCDQEMREQAAHTLELCQDPAAREPGEHRPAEDA